MILQQLQKDSDRILPDMPPPMYNLKPVRWVISLDKDGELEGFIRTDGEGKRAKRGLERLVPMVTRTVGVRPILVADTFAYTLGLSDDRRAAEKHDAYRKLVEQCAKDTAEPAMHAVSRFLESWVADQFPEELLEEIADGDIITFRVNGVFPADLTAVRTFWSANARESKQTGGGQCLICGQQAEIVDRQPQKIKGLIGGQPAGTDLVSINAAAFESYGLRAAYSSPTCRDCGERYAKSINALIRGERTHLNIGSSVFVFWTTDEGFNPLDFFDRPTPETVQDLLGSYLKGKRYSEVNTTDFYATSLTANSARAVVRDWLHTTVGAAQDRLADWFLRLEIVNPYGDPGEPLRLYQLASSLYRDARKEMEAHVPRLLIRSALYGDRLPDTVLAQAVRRNRAEQGVTHARAALIKAVLTSALIANKEIQGMSRLDAQHPDAAYQCGRLLAELEALQKQALRGINTTIVDRFYGAASTAPATVFGNLLRGAQPHLSVLRRTNEPAFNGIQRRLEEIMSAIGTFPSALALRDQARFSLGYYHQRAENRATILEAAGAKKAARDAKQSPGNEETGENDRTHEEITR